MDSTGVSVLDIGEKMRIDFKKVPVHLEIERRYLLATPPPLASPALAHARPLKIVQTQLRSIPGFIGSSRARMTRNPDGTLSYHWAAKRRMNAVTKTEAETEIDKRTYEWLLRYANERPPLVKTRWKFQFGGVIFELDHVREPHDQWILEVELENENQQFSMPAFLDIQSELTA